MTAPDRTGDLARLPFGYTNGTRREPRGIRKTYTGPGSRQRFETEAAVLEAAAGLLPVPRVLERADSPPWLLLEDLPGVTVEEAIRGPGADALLFGVGRLARAIDEARLPAPAHFSPGPGRLIHGDFSLQNILCVDGAITGVVDWELARLGGAVEDLAWAEWIVMTYHPDAVRALAALYEGYGSRPDWPARRAAMLRGCAARIEWARRHGDAVDVERWRGRLERAAALSAPG